LAVRATQGLKLAVAVGGVNNVAVNNRQVTHSRTSEEFGSEASDTPQSNHKHVGFLKAFKGVGSHQKFGTFKPSWKHGGKSTYGWLLAAGYWLLALGFWLLAAGHWFSALVSINSPRRVAPEAKSK
jgi:hypothetical protein